jgi:hypothetical protein
MAPRQADTGAPPRRFRLGRNWGKRMLCGIALVLVGSGILAIGGSVAHVLGTVLAVAGLLVIPYLTVFDDD